MRRSPVYHQLVLQNLIKLCSGFLVEYIYQLEQDKSKLLNQNAQLKRLVTTQNGDGAGSGGGTVYSSPHSPAVDIPPTIVKRRKTIDGNFNI